MATNLLKLQASLGLDSSEYNKGLNEAQQKAERAAKPTSAMHVSLAKMSKSIIKGFTAAVAGLSAGVAAVGKLAIDYNSKIETYTTSFTTLLGDAGKAAEKIDELKKMAAKTPFGLSDLADATKTLLAFQVPANKVNNTLKMLGDVALGDKEKMKGLALVFGQVSSAGKLQGQDLMQLINQGFNPLNYIAKRTGESMAELRKRMSEGKVSADEVAQAFKDATSAGGQFYKGMENASKTTSGLISTLKDDAAALVGEVFKPISEGLLHDVLPSAIGAIKELSDAYKEEGLDGLVEATGTVLGEVVTKISNKAPDLIQVVVDIINSFIETIQHNLPTIADAASNIAVTLLNALIEMLPSIISMGATFVLDFTKGIIANIPQILTTSAQAAEKFIDGILDSFEDIFSLGAELVGALIGGLTGQNNNIWNSGLEILDTIVEAIMTGIQTVIGFGKSFVSWLINDIGNGIKEKAKDIFNLGAKILKIIGKGLTFQWKEASELAKEVVGDITNTWTSAKDAIGKGVATLTTYVADKVDKSSKRANTIVQNAGEAMANGFRNGMSKGAEGASDAIIPSDDTVKGELIPKGTAVGISVGTAVGQGLQTGIAGAGEKTKNLWEEILEGLAYSTVDFVKNVVSDVSGMVGSLFSGLSDVGEALYRNENAWDAFGSAAMSALVDVLKAIGAQLAALAVAKALAFDWGGAAMAAAGSAAAYLAAGIAKAAIHTNASSASAATTASTDTPASPESKPPSETPKTPDSNRESEASGVSIFSTAKSEKQIILEIDGKVLGKFAYDAYNNENRRVGVRLT